MEVEGTPKWQSVTGSRRPGGFELSLAVCASGEAHLRTAGWNRRGRAAGGLIRARAIVLAGATAVAHAHVTINVGITAGGSCQ